MSEEKSQPITWYRVPLGPDDKKALHEKSDLHGAIQSGGFLLCYLSTFTLSLYSFFQWVWPLTLLFIFLHGTLSSLMIIAVHELTHGTVFRTKSLNTLFARIFAFLGWINPDWFQASHARHHRYTLHQPDDLEVVLPLSFMVRDFLLTGFINPLRAVKNTDASIINALRLAFGRFTREWEQIVFPASEPQKRRAAIRWARTLLIGHALILLIALLTNLWILPVLITLSPFYGGWLLFLCGNTQHVGLQDSVDDFRLCCRTFTTTPLIGFLYWHMNYHIEHHMYAAVPCYRLGKLHRLIRHALPPTPHGLLATWREIASILKIQRTNPSYQHIAPLPSPQSA